MRKGSRHTPEAIARIAASTVATYAEGKRAVTVTAMLKAAAEANRGKHPSEETRSKLSLALKGRPQSEQHRLNVIEAKKEYFRLNPQPPHSEAHKQAIGVSTKRALALISDEAKARRSQPKTDDEKLARSEAMKRNWAILTPDERERRSQLAKDSWLRASPEEKDRRLNSAKGKSSGLESTVALILTALGVTFERQVRIDSFVADFVVAEKMLVVECDGEYWHSLPGIPEKDRRKDAVLIANGYKVLRLPGETIKSGEAEQILRLAV